MGEEGQVGGAVQGQCEICNKSPSQYRCPACEIQTCSFICIKQHKSTSNCTGLRPPPKSSYLPSAQLTPEVMAIDGTLLEGAAESVSNLARVATAHPSKRYSSLQYLQRFCARERALQLCLMPAGMERAALNKSVVGRDGIIRWTVEWLIINPNEPLQDHPEYLSLSILANHINQEFYSSEREDSTVMDSFNAVITNNHLNVRSEEVQFYLRNEPDKGHASNSEVSHNRRLWPLRSADISWRLLLANRTLIEFPTIYIYFKNSM